MCDSPKRLLSMVPRFLANTHITIFSLCLGALSLDAVNPLSPNLFTGVSLTHEQIMQLPTAEKKRTLMLLNPDLKHLVRRLFLTNNARKHCNHCPIFFTSFYYLQTTFLGRETPKARVAQN